MRKSVNMPDGVFLRPIQQRDSVLIADQLRYGVRLNSLPEGTRLVLPQWKDTLTSQVEIVAPWKIDTLSFSKAGKERPASLDVEAYVVLTSFDEGLHDLPAIDVVRWFPDGVTDTISFRSQQLVVTTIPVDTASFTVHDIKGQAEYPLTFREVLPYLGGALALAALSALAAWLLVRRRRRREAASGARREPAHIVALREIDRWRGEKHWEPAHQKAFYSGVTDALRTYIDARYGISAMEMTTQEIFSKLSAEDIPDDLLAQMKELFERADFVKFAKHAADREENASVVPAAVRFVTSTYQAEVDTEAVAGAPQTQKKEEE